MGAAVGTRRRLGVAWIAAAVAVLAVLLVPVAGAQTSRGTDFWLAFPSNLGTPELTLYVSGDTATTGTVEIPGLEFNTAFDVEPGRVTSIPLPAGAQLEGGEALLNLGVHVTANDPVTVYGLNHNEETTDAYLALPVDALGTDYVALGYGGGNSTLAIVGTQDDTTVTITPSGAFDSHAAGEAFQISLNQGFAYQLAGDEVSGTIISADKPVSVFGGAMCASIPADGFACNHLVEQLPPTAHWGKSFVTEPLATRTKGDTFRILASADGTSVAIDGVNVASLDRGQLYETVLAAPSQIEADKPVLVMQYSNSSTYDGAAGDPFELVVPPTDQFLTGYTVWTPASGYANYINVVAPTPDVGSVLLDGSAVDAHAFAAIGSSGFSGAQVAVDPGSHTLSAPHGFGASVYGLAAFDGYGYPAGYGTSEGSPPVTPSPAAAPPPRTDVSLSVSGPSYVRVGSGASFTDTMANSGPNDATGVELQVPLPPDASLASATLSNGNPCQLSGGTVTCFVGTVAAGGSATGTLVFTPSQPGPLTQSASVQADYDANPANNSGSASTQVIAADAPPPPPPPPAQPGTFNAIGTGTVTVDGQPLTPDTLTLITSGSTVDVTNGMLTLTDFDHGSGTFGNEQLPPRRRVASLHASPAAGSVPALVKVEQPATPGAAVTLTLVGGSFSACTSSRREAAKNQAPVRQLWGQAKGTFTTKGRYSAATIRGTTWLTQDRCDGTLTSAIDDVVDVADLVKKKTVSLQPGQSYLAQPAPKQQAKGQTPASVRKHGLVWASKLFVSKAQLAAWLAAHGTSWAQFAAKNPRLAAALAARG